MRRATLRLSKHPSRLISRIPRRAHSRQGHFDDLEATVIAGAKRVLRRRDHRQTEIAASKRSDEGVIILMADRPET